MSQSKRIIKFEAIRFHQPAFILGKTLSGFTPKEQPHIILRETASGDFEFVELDRKTGMNRVAWVPSTTIESITYHEKVDEKA